MGTTRGRGRHGTGATTKDSYVLPLDASWQTVLCRRADGTIRVRTAAEPRAPREWIEAELGGTDVGDTRLTARLLQMTGMFYAKPTANMPAACGSAHAATAAYRFLDEVFTACAQTPHGAQLLIRADRSRTRKVLTNDETCEFL